MKVKNTILLLFFILHPFVRAQTLVTDSLKRELKVAKHDTTRCNLLELLINVELDDNVWPNYNNELITICLKNIKGQDKPLNKTDTFYISHLCIGYNNTGYIYQSQGNYSKAIEEFDKCISYGKKIGDVLNLSMTYNNIGGIYAEQNNNTKALEYFKKSLELREKLNDKDGISQCLLNISSIYDAMGDKEKSILYGNKSLVYCKEIHEMNRIALIYNNLGTIYRDKLEIDKALEYFKRSEIIFDSLKLKRGLSVVYGNFADTYIIMKKNDKAKQYAVKALDYALEIGYPVHVKNQAQTLYKIESMAGNWKSALDYYKLYIKMRDSLFGIENEKAAIKQQLKFDFDKQRAIEETNHIKELQLSNERGQKQKIISIGVVVVLILILIFAVILYRRLRISDQQKREIVAQKNIVDEKQREILDSINYAKRIQKALMSSERYIDRTMNALKSSNKKDQ